MVPPETPPTDPRRSDPSRSLIRRQLGFSAGAGLGLILWTIIGLTTGNLALGIVFGLLPGIAIGVGLQLTASK